MWIFLNNAMLSVVQHKDHRAMLLARARIEGDLERAFPLRTKDVVHTPEADYAYRLVVTRAEMDVAMTAAVRSIDYVNFKGSVRDGRRGDAYLQVWMTMGRYQEVAAEDAARKLPAKKSSARQRKAATK